MRFDRLKDFVFDILCLPLCLIFGIGTGVCLGVVAWWTKIKITWSMRDSSYVWEKDNEEKR